MSVEDLKERVRKLSGRATARKMDLHDLSEELPVNWQSILEVAQKTYDAFKDLEEARKELKQAEQNA